MRRELARSRGHASDLIAAGRVLVGGIAATKATTMVERSAPVVVKEPANGEADYVSRGGHKLAGALEHFKKSGLEVAQRNALDAGASTGGFTDVLLRAGIAHVIAADVGYGQLAWSLQQDERVTVMDRTNIRSIEPQDLPYAPDLVVSDLSFISLKTVLPALAACSATGADLLLMVKPQFEVGKERLGSGGVVKSPQLRAEAVLSVARSAQGLGFSIRDVVASPLPGPSGNVEYFLWLRNELESSPEVEPESEKGVELLPEALTGTDLEAAVERAVKEGPKK